MSDIVFEIERLYLACCVQTGTVYASKYLSCDDFSDKTHSAAFKVVVDVFTRYGKFDFVHVQASPALTDIDNPSAVVQTIVALKDVSVNLDNVSDYARKIKEYAYARKETLETSKIQGHTPAIDIAKILKDGLAKYEQIVMDKGQCTAFSDPAKIQHQLQDRMNRFMAGTEFSTGISELDKVTGGFLRKMVTVIAARPGGGKTTWAIYAALRLAQRGKKVLFISKEQDIEFLQIKLLSTLVHVDSMRLILGQVTYEEAQRILDVSLQLRDMSLFLDDNTKLSVDEMWSKIHDMKPDIVFIDYFQILSLTESARGSSGAVDILDDIMTKIRFMTRDENIAMVVLSQFSRQMDRKLARAAGLGEVYTPSMSDLKGAGSIEEAAALVLSLVDPHPGEFLDDIEKTKLMKCIISKQRCGAGVGRIFDLRYIPKYSMFTACEEEQIGEPIEE